MNAEFINPFLTSILNVLSTMAQTNAQPGKPEIKKDKTAKGDVTGVIGMAGEQTKGSLAITFSEPAILHIASKMLMEEFTEIDEAVIDTVGEITNMVTGGAKKLLAEKGYKFDLAIPTTISGKGHTINHKSSKAIVMIPFTMDAGDFFVEVSFEQ